MSVTPKTEGSHDCTCTHLLCRGLLSPETKWKAKQDPRLMTALLLFSPGGITTLIVVFLGDFEVPLLLIAELMSFEEFENSLFSSFSTVKCYMLTFYSAHYEFRDTEMTGVLLHILPWFSQLKNAYPNPATATRHLLEKCLWEPSSCPTRGSTAFVPAPPDFYLCVWLLCHACRIKLGEDVWSCHPRAGFTTEQSMDWVVTAGVGSLGQGMCIFCLIWAITEQSMGTSRM